MKNIKYKKVIIWGHPIYSHTHSYIHEAYYKAFKSMGYDTYWFEDNKYPQDFDYTNCLFIGEGFADKNIPINDSSCYCIMYCPSPAKYIGKVGKYIDIRMAATSLKDHIQEYVLDKTTAVKIGPACYYDEKKSEKVRINNNYHDYEIDDYDKFYISWATNLLPSEFNEDDIYLKRDNTIYFCGNLSSGGVCENTSTFTPFIEECKKNNVKFIHNNSWIKPLSTTDVISLTKKSYMAVDIRGPEHIRNKILTCRIMKNISYGHLGLTNSEGIYEELDGNCILNTNTAELFYEGERNKTNYSLIKKSMQYVKENHTYLNRIDSLLQIV